MSIQAGAYVSILGDSLSAFEGTVPRDYPSFYGLARCRETGVYGTRDMWWGQVLLHFGARLLANNSFAGSYVCRPYRCELPTYACSEERTGALAVDGILPEHIFIAIGSNDRGCGFALTSEDKSDLTVIENAYRLMLGRVKKNYPSATVWCLTFPVTTCTNEPEFRFPERRGSVPMHAYSELVARVAAEEGCHTVDLHTGGLLCDTVDRLHPTAEGMRVLAERVIAVIEATGGAPVGEKGAPPAP